MSDKPKQNFDLAINYSYKNNRNISDPAQVSNKNIFIENVSVTLVREKNNYGQIQISQFAIVNEEDASIAKLFASGMNVTVNRE